VSSSGISGEKTEANRGGDDYWVVKLDQSGAIQWDKTVGGSDIDELHCLQQTRAGGYILGGFSHSNISGEKSENARNYPLDDYWVVKLDKNGSFKWDKTVGGNNQDRLQSIKEIGVNRYILAGYSDSRTTGDKTVKSRGSTDYWLVKLVYEKPPIIAETQNESNVVIPKINSSNFSVSPNPAKDVLHVQISGTAILSLTDQSGKVLLTTTINGSGIINVAGLKPGLYYLKSSATGAVQKIIITK